MEAQVLSGGFSDPARQSAHAFRALMEAMARPGTVHTITGAKPPAPLSAAAGTALLSLCDADITLFLAGEADCEPVRKWLSFHTGAPLVGATEAMFAVGTWDALAPISAFPIGTPEYPDRSTTLIVEMPQFSKDGAKLKGPGIQDEAQFGLPDIAAFQANKRQFPQGLDFYFTCKDQIAALPRSTEVL
ncbi:MAG: phosphonate C-P lyase system protein PhnH [Pseudomonadota bacterium]